MPTHNDEHLDGYDDSNYTDPLFKQLSKEKPEHKAIKDHKPLRCLILRETQAAILVEVMLTEKSEWFPLSQVSYINNVQDVLNSHDTDSKDGHYTDTIHVAKWLLDKKGIKY